MNRFDWMSKSLVRKPPVARNSLERLGRVRLDRVENRLKGAVFLADADDGIRRGPADHIQVQHAEDIFTGNEGSRGVRFTPEQTLLLPGPQGKT